MKNDENQTNSQQKTCQKNSALTSEPTYEQQRQLDKEKRQREEFLGKRQRKTIEAQQGGRASQTDGGRGVRAFLVPAMSNYLQKHLDYLESRGHVGTAASELKRLAAWVDVTTMCHITLSVVLDKLGRGSTIRTKIGSVQIAIGEQVEDQALIAYMEEADPAYFTKLQRYYLNDPVRRYDKKVGGMKRALNNHDSMEWNYMGKSEHVRVGSLLLKALMSIQIQDTGEGFIESKKPLWNDPNRKTPKKGQKDSLYLAFTKTGLLYRDQLQAASDNDAMLPKPMVCEPLDWSIEQRGGYLHHVNRKYSQVVHGNTGSQPSQMVFDALNRLQKTAFRINHYILDVQEQLQRHSWEIGSFRTYEKDSWEKEHFPIVDSAYIATLDKDSDEYKQTMRTLTEAYHNQKLDEQKADPPRRTFLLAKEFKDEKIWFPWFLDRRGRLYPSVNGLSPQGSDYGKALLRSADGSPVTEDTRRDLLISIATAGAFDGVDKKDFFERLKWGEQYTSTEEFKAMVEDPTTHRHWMSADEPFCFLALCEEYKAVILDETRSRVYVFFGRDQTCSGVQILSAVIQDEKAAYYTNVLVTEEPQDLYGEVAKEARVLLRDKTWLQQQMEGREAKRIKLNAKRKPDNQIEPRWKVEFNPDDLGRSELKVSVMTTGYGSTLRTRYGAIKKALMKKQKKGTIPNIDPGDINIVCKSGTDGMELAFPAYMELNKWFKDFAKAAVKAGCEQITWTTPTGMFVSQEYREPLFEQVKTYAAGGGHYAKLGGCHEGATYLETGYGDVALSKSQSAIAANFVHSLDASVMVLGILNTPKEAELYTVHDCIYTLSGYFGQTIPHFRDALYNVVTSPVLEELLESNGLTDQVGLPPIGEIDLKQIKESPYLFC